MRTIKKLQQSITLSTFTQRLSLVLVISLLLMVCTPFLTAQAQAAAMTEAGIRLGRMGASEVADATNNQILVVFKPASTATEASIKVTWPAGFTVSATGASHTSTTTGIPSTFNGEALVAVPTLGTPGTVSGQEVTFTTGDLTAGTLYGFYVTGGITNPASAGTRTVTLTTQATGPSTIDTASVAVHTVGVDEDQVSVTATVPPTFNFDITDNALALGELAVGAVTANAMGTAIDIDTNADNGWVAWIRSEGSTDSLYSSTTAYGIESTDGGAAAVTLTAGTEGYVVDAASSGTVDAQYNGGSDNAASNTSTAGGVVSTSYEVLASSTTTASNATLTIAAAAAISGTTPAGSDYSDILEIVGAANF